MFNRRISSNRGLFKRFNYKIMYENRGPFLENVAMRWLKTKGLKVVAREYISSAGGIDLIMLDDSTLCFIDVIYRGSQDIGNIGYNISTSEKKKMIQTASSFVNHQYKYLDHPKRFDALFIEPGIDEPYEMNWVKNI